MIRECGSGVSNRMFSGFKSRCTVISLVAWIEWESGTHRYASNEDNRHLWGLAYLWAWITRETYLIQWIASTSFIHTGRCLGPPHRPDKSPAEASSREMKCLRVSTPLGPCEIRTWVHTYVLIRKHHRIERYSRDSDFQNINLSHHRIRCWFYNLLIDNPTRQSLLFDSM